MIDALFNALQGNFATDRQRIALKDVPAPLHAIPLNVRQELLEQNAFVVQLLLLLLLDRQVELDLSEHLADRVVELSGRLADSNLVCLLDQGAPVYDLLEKLLFLGDIVHGGELDLDRADLVAQLLVPQVLRLVIGLSGRLHCHGWGSSHRTACLHGVGTLEELFALSE